jgi:hypothetical protein
MLPFEWLIVGYAAFFAAAALVWRSRPRRQAALIVSLATIGLVLVVVCIVPRARWIAPNVYLILAYWLPALLVPARRDQARISAFEEWLARSDAALRPRLPAVPRLLTTLTELAYLSCYPIVPIAFALVWFRGGEEATARFWTAVIAAGLACYVSLPWLISRPPEKVKHLSAQRLRQVNAFVLSRVSHAWTTFPSGHVGVSCAAALAVARVWPVAGFIVGVVAIGVLIGAAAGRYHYVIDVLLGAVVALVAVMVT